MSKRKTVSLIIALLLDNLYKNSDTFIPNLGWGVKTTKDTTSESVQEREREKVN